MHHAKTKKHIKAIEPFSSSRIHQATLDVKVKNLKDSIAEAKLAMFVCNHSAILSIDHLSILCNNFLMILELFSCEAESLAVTVKETLNNFGLSLENLIGIATDNCSTMIGINNDLYQKLKKDVPNLILIKCICHSLQLAVSHATLYKQIKQRLPDNIDIMEKINLFSVENVLKHNKLSITCLLTEMNIDPLQISQIELEYNKIHLIKWNNTSFLVLPVSNAEVESIFSQLNLVKNKTRNKLSLNMINSILCTRYGLRRHEKCCYDYELPENVLRRIDTNEAYP
ncbi:hypothetical protein ALC60_14095 [Trachymyrmex zeteki]|uniref:DUF4371 domain-containing protein n=1 Tax=Mycetomoellerius zeteki TaxID=64791 RepID=A0A151WGC9_9HYME|nr:hypothetical protein ALC60_14095 [Trachymyrmex zeteki]